MATKLSTGGYYDPEKLSYHPKADQLASLIQTRAEADTPVFFRMMVSYFFAKVAATMRAQVVMQGQEIPINLYCCNLAPSGYGKSKSMNFLEDNVTHLFFERFKDETLPAIALTNMAQIANTRAIRKQTDPDDELKTIEAEYDRCGEFHGSFDSATGPALKQFRHKLLLAAAGSLNLEIDEIGDNLTGNAEAFSKLMELYDKGTIKESLIKNTKENIRSSEVKGKTPTNLIMFGTSSSLFDGSKREDEFMSMLEKGYARRCLFAFIKEVDRMQLNLTADELYEQATRQADVRWVEDMAEHLMALADQINFKKKIYLEKAEDLIRLDYVLHCRNRANELSEFDTVRKIELENRSFKALKLAGAYAFIDGSSKITEQHLYNAIAIVEDSGKELDKLLTRDRPYVKLAKYLGQQKRPVTQADLSEDLPFYKGNAGAKSEMMSLAIAWGYNNHIVIKKSYQEGIEFLRGETLEKTNTNELTVSYSTHVAYNYLSEYITWDQLGQLTQADGYHWVSHHVLDGHRSEEKAVPGFNLIVIDVDGGTKLSTAQTLLKDYKAMFYTTKRHGEDNQDRFRIILPMQYCLKLDASDFKEFMHAVYQWLPFEVDDQTGQRARKWLSHKGNLYVQDGELFDPLTFIPRTSKNEERKQRLLDQQSLTNLERWFVNHTGLGNRSNNLIRYALLLVDGGKSLTDVEASVRELNRKIQDPLPDDEITHTIMVSAAKAYAKLQAAA